MSPFPKYSEIFQGIPADFKIFREISKGFHGLQMNIIDDEECYGILRDSFKT